MSNSSVFDGGGSPLPPPPASSLRTRKPKRPWWAVVAGIVALPILEIGLLILLGRSIGVWWTLLLLVVEAALGAWLLRREGRRAWHAITAAVTNGERPTGQMATAAVVFVGGILFILPGLLTDILGLLCLVPVTRPLMSRLLLASLGLNPSREPAAVQRHRPSGAGQTIEGEVVEGTVHDQAGPVRYLGR